MFISAQPQTASELFKQRDFSFLKTRAWQIIASAVVYFVSGSFYLFQGMDKTTAPIIIFAASGFALAFAVFFEYSIWPGVFLGRLGLAIYTGLPWSLAMAVAIIHSIEFILAATFVRRIKLQVERQTIRDLLYLYLLIFFILQPLSATLGTGVLWLFGIIRQSDLGYFWFTWWLGNGLGQLFFTPFIVSTSYVLLKHGRLVWSQWIKAILILITGWAILRAGYTQELFLELLFPLLIFAALAWGLPGATSVTLLVLAFIFSVKTAKGIFPEDVQTMGLEINISLIGGAFLSQLFIVNPNVKTTK